MGDEGRGQGDTGKGHDPINTRVYYHISCPRG